MRPHIALAALSLFCASGMAQDVEDLRAKARTHIAEADKESIPALDFGARNEWLNVSRPLSLSKDLKGRVVLIDFWTYCCINCLHVLPDLEYLEKKYAGRPFTVIGCHSAKFENEAERDNIREAVVRNRIEHPVVVDKDFEIWRSFGVRAWPTLILVGPDGRVIGRASGEGNREVLDVFIDEALKYYGKKGKLQPRPIPMRLERDTLETGALAFPGKVLFEGGKLYVADTNHNRILAFSVDGSKAKLSWLAGGGEIGFKDGVGDDALFFHPQGMTLHDGALYVADTENHALRKIDLATKTVTTLAGTGEQGRTRRGTHAGEGLALNSPWDLLVRDDFLYIAMAGSHQIWRMSLKTNRLAPFAGSGGEARTDGRGVQALLAQPSGLTADKEWLYFADSESSSIRRARFADGEVETVVGGDPDPHNLFRFGDVDGKGFKARLQHPLGVFFDGKVIYVADTYNHKIRVLDPADGSIRGLVGGFDEPAAVAPAGRTLYVADTNRHRIQAVDLDTLESETVALEGVPAVRVKSVEIPGTEIRSFGKVTLKPGARIRFKASIPKGWKFQDAPGAALFLGEASTPIKGETTVLDAAPSGVVEIRAVYYPCGDDGICRIRSLVFRGEIERAETGLGALDLLDLVIE